MTLNIGAIAPDFEADTTHGRIHFHDWIGDSWCMLFTHPKDFTPVCTTELASMAVAMPEFSRRGIKLINLSVDSVEDHKRWSKDIEGFASADVSYPMIGDTDLAISKLYDMLPAETSGTADKRNAMDNAPARCVYIIGPDKRIKATTTYPMTTGRDGKELLRVIDSLMLTAGHGVATPAGWRQGEDVIIVPSVADAAAREKFPDGWKTPLPYMRVVKQPA